MRALPTLVVVSGPTGTGKTTLAHRLAAAIGCPAICRDEIKEGMVHTAGPGFVAAPGDELTMRTLPTFFAVLDLLLSAGATTVAEAAFQDRVWRPRLAPLQRLARLRIVQCTVDTDVALARAVGRDRHNPTRRAHAHPGTVAHGTDFDRVSIDAPTIEVDTTDGYRPDLAAIVDFVNG